MVPGPLSAHVVLASEGGTCEWLVVKWACGQGSGMSGAAGGAQQGRPRPQASRPGQKPTSRPSLPAPGLQSNEWWAEVP